MGPQTNPRSIIVLVTTFFTDSASAMLLSNILSSSASTGRTSTRVKVSAHVIGPIIGASGFTIMWGAEAKVMPQLNRIKGVPLAPKRKGSEMVALPSSSNRIGTPLPRSISGNTFATMAGSSRIVLSVKILPLEFACRYDSGMATAVSRTSLSLPTYTVPKALWMTSEIGFGLLQRKLIWTARLASELGFSPNGQTPGIYMPSSPAETSQLIGLYTGVNIE
jgi:hypothetical protein